MKALLYLLLCIVTTNTFSQYGYVKLEKDSILKGYIRNFRTVTDAQEGFEVWKTKTDKNPARILKQNVFEYAIGKDTIKVLHDVTPYDDEDLYFDVIDARYVLRGKIDLLKVRNYRAKTFTPTAAHAGTGSMTILPMPHHLDEPGSIYFLEDHTGTLRAIKWGGGLRQSLSALFSETFINRYEQRFGKITYNKLPNFVKFVNSK